MADARAAECKKDRSWELFGDFYDGSEGTWSKDRASKKTCNGMVIDDLCLQGRTRSRRTTREEGRHAGQRTALKQVLKSHYAHKDGLYTHVPPKIC